MKKTICQIRRLSISAAFITLILSSTIYGHCEIPCGIYGDSLRMEMIKEHITTIEKSMNQINLLSKESTANINQLVRWVRNKEEHANKIQDIVSQYFLHQRIKLTDPVDDKYEQYVTNLTLLHEISVYSMKAKQSTDLNIIDNLKKSITTFEENYFHRH
ncbi:superoxide dismutase [Ni] [Candidatus Neomarinimicrobiota bacterium]